MSRAGGAARNGSRTRFAPQRQHAAPDFPSRERRGLRRPGTREARARSRDFTFARKTRIAAASEMSATRRTARDAKGFLEGRNGRLARPSVLDTEVGWLRTSNGSKASPADASENAFLEHRPKRRSSARRGQASLGLLSACLERRRRLQTARLSFATARSLPRTASPLPLPLGDRRSSNWGDSTVRIDPEMCVERPENGLSPSRRRRPIAA